jgi:preprotein translocase subunit SecE
MGTDEETEKDSETPAADPAEDGQDAPPEAELAAANAELAVAGGEATSQLGHTRFVYAAYFAGGIGVAFLATKIVAGIWHQVAKKWPQAGEPVDQWIYPIAIALGVGVPLYYWRKKSSRQYAEEVAEELSKVSWPTKKEVTNSTTVVVVTTIIATIFFALLDQFWRFVTDKVYGI